MSYSALATLKRAPAPGRKQVKTARKSRLRMTPWPKTQVKPQARAPEKARLRRLETSSAAAIRRMVNSEERMAANDVAPGETEEANLVPMAAANDPAGEA